MLLPIPAWKLVPQTRLLYCSLPVRLACRVRGSSTLVETTLDVTVVTVMKVVVGLTVVTPEVEGLAARVVEVPAALVVRLLVTDTQSLPQSV